MTDGRKDEPSTTRKLSVHLQCSCSKPKLYFSRYSLLGFIPCRRALDDGFVPGDRRALAARQGAAGADGLSDVDGAIAHVGGQVREEEALAAGEEAALRARCIGGSVGLNVLPH